MNLIKELQGLYENDERLPTPQEFNAACDAATEIYQESCDEHFNDNKEHFGDDVESYRPWIVTDFEQIYWDAVNEVFMIKVEDRSKMSHDDGMFIKVDKGEATISGENNPDKFNNVITTMHTDPKVQAALKKKLGSFRHLTDDEVNDLQDNV